MKWDFCIQLYTEDTYFKCYTNTYYNFIDS